MNLVPTKSHSNYMGTTVYHGPNVIGLWWPALNSGFGTDIYRNSLTYLHLSCLHSAQPAHSPQRKEH